MYQLILWLIWPQDHPWPTRTRVHRLANDCLT
jgi:hypothetical protein